MKFWLKSVIVPPGTTLPTVIVNGCVQGSPPPAAVISIEKLMTVPHATPVPTLNVKWGELQAELAPGERSGYEAVALFMVMPGVEVERVAVIPVAGWLPMFFRTG